MNSLLTLAFVSTLFVTASSANAAIIIYNQSNPPSAGNGAGSYQGFSVSFSDGALTTVYTDGETSTPATVQLTDLTIGFANVAGQASNALLKVYTASSHSASEFVGDSTNQRNVAGASSNHQETFTFDRLELDLSKTYYFYFAQTEGDGSVDAITFTTGRMSVSNNANDTYSSGSLYDATFAARDIAYDAIFAATFVP